MIEFTLEEQEIAPNSLCYFQQGRYEGKKKVPCGARINIATLDTGKSNIVDKTVCKKRDE